MRKVSKIFIAYFPVMLVAGQVIVNWLYFVARDWYITAGFYLNTFFGTNVFFAVMLVVLTRFMNFCKVSKYAALAELAFAVNFMIVKEDNIYNIVFQIIVGSAALIATLCYYMYKHQQCNFSVGVSFLGNAVMDRSCQKSLDKFDAKVKKAVLQSNNEG